VSWLVGVPANCEKIAKVLVARLDQRNLVVRQAIAAGELPIAPGSQRRQGLPIRERGPANILVSRAPVSVGIGRRAGIADRLRVRAGGMGLVAGAGGKQWSQDDRG